MDLKNREEKLSELIDEIIISNNNPLNPDLEYGAYLYKYSEEENDMFKILCSNITKRDIIL